jgi:hypothetical protein
LIDENKRLSKAGSQQPWRALGFGEMTLAADPGPGGWAFWGPSFRNGAFTASHGAPDGSLLYAYAAGLKVGVNPGPRTSAKPTNGPEPLAQSPTRLRAHRPH